MEEHFDPVEALLMAALEVLQDVEVEPKDVNRLNLTYAGRVQEWGERERA